MQAALEWLHAQSHDTASGQPVFGSHCDFEIDKTYPRYSLVAKSSVSSADHSICMVYIAI